MESDPLKSLLACKKLISEDKAEVEKKLELIEKERSKTGSLTDEKLEKEKKLKSILKNKEDVLFSLKECAKTKFLID